MASIQWEPRTDQPDRPVVDGALLRGVAYALLPALGLWSLIIWTIWERRWELLGAAVCAIVIGVVLGSGTR